MPITTGFHYLNSCEWRARLATALDVARSRLSPFEFAAFSPQLEDKIRDADREILDFQDRLIWSHVSPMYQRWASGAYFLYTVGPSLLREVSPTVLVNSRHLGALECPFPRAARSAQASFAFPR